MHPVNNAAEHWNSAYENRSAPWIIDQPQPEIVSLEQTGRITGTVLDIGCGTGENTIYLAERGYDVLGIDISPPAIDAARRNASERGVPFARFAVADALQPGESTYDTIMDSALFHIFDDHGRGAYVESLRALCKSGGVVHLLTFGPQIDDSVIRDAFGAGWHLEELRPARYRGRITESIAAQARAKGWPEQELVDVVARLVSIRRL